MNQAPTTAAATELELLKAMARDRYDQDEGEMFECFDDEDYVEEIERYKTAEAAWTAHMRTLECQREAGGYYEQF